MAGLPHEVSPAYVYESNVHLGNILMTLNEQRKCGLLCDISIKVQDVEYKAHKAILASCSSYFNRIILNPKNISDNLQMELHNVSGVGLENLLEFAYTSRLTVSLANVDDIIWAAQELDFKNVEFSCLNYLKQKLLMEKSPSFPPSVHEVSSSCENGVVSRSDEQQKPARASAAEYQEKKQPVKSDKCDCPIRAMLASFGSKKKSNSTSSADRKSLKQNGDAASARPEACEQISHEQHQAMMRNILEVHGLEAATVDERAAEIGAAEIKHGATSNLDEKKYPGYLSPCYNSDTDDTGSSVDGELDSCSYSMRPCGESKQPAIKLPYTTDEITSMPRSELQTMLTGDPNLTKEQICAIHEIRRRGKNRIAAQRCRKRKMENIQSMSAEIERLAQQREELMKQRRETKEQASKLSNKFRARCEKFFKCDKKGCLKKKFCNSATSTSTTMPEDRQPMLAEDNITAQNFHEHARTGLDMCEKLKQAPVDDLPPCPLLYSDAGESSNDWRKPCTSPENITCSIVTDDSGGSQHGHQVCCPTTAYAMSPSQGLGSDFGNIHISPPVDAHAALPVGQARISVVQHTRSVDGQRHVLPPFATLATPLVSHPGFDAHMTEATQGEQ